MKKILLLSDTHGYLDAQMLKFIKQADEVWHAGDIGTMEVADRIAGIKPFRAVYGNIDGGEIRSSYSCDTRFTVENLDVWMTHIGGYPNRYEKRVLNELQENPPDLFISGHSHILKVIYDKKFELLHMNPGAAGKYGFHKKRTMLRFQIIDKKIENLEIIELEDR